MNQFLRNTIFFIGWVLSPLTFWNDAFVNIPLSYLLANILVRFIRADFLLLVLIAYWFTNALGLYMMYATTRQIFKGRGEALKEILKLTGKHGHRHYLETNGTLAAELGELIEHIDIVAMDLKFPSSSGMGDLWEKHRDFLKIARRKEVFLKAIICQSTQEEDLREALNLIKEVSPASILILQPNSYEDRDILQEKLGKFKEICSRANVIACVIPQIHKIVGLK